MYELGYPQAAMAVLTVPALIWYGRQVRRVTVAARARLHRIRAGVRNRIHRQVLSLLRDAQPQANGDALEVPLRPPVDPG